MTCAQEIDRKRAYLTSKVWGTRNDLDTAHKISQLPYVTGDIYRRERAIRMVQRAAASFEVASREYADFLVTCAKKTLDKDSGSCYTPRTINEW